MIKITLGALAGLLLLASVAVTPAAATSEVCVYLEPGAWYAANFWITSGQFTSPNSGNFPIGQWRCISTTGIADGAKFAVWVNAIAGNTTQCTDQQNRNEFVNVASNPYPLMLFADKGSTLSHRCFLPN